MRKIIAAEHATSLESYLIRVRKAELKYMYSHGIDDPDFGIETDKYRVCNAVLNGDMTPESMLSYMKKYYGEYEADFIQNIEKYI